MSADDRFAEFVRAATPQLVRTAYLLTGSRAAAEDLVQDTFLKLFRRRAWLLAADVPMAYARRALTNQFLSDRRRRSAGEIVTDTTGVYLNEPGDGPDFAVTIADRDELWELLLLLPDRQRAAVVLRYYHDLSDDDIAAALECRPGTVRSLISRGLAALRVQSDLTTDGAGQ